MTLEQLADAMRDLKAMRRIVVCEPGLGLKIEALVLRHGMDHLWTVRESRHCPAGKILLINEPGGL